MPTSLFGRIREGFAQRNLVLGCVIGLMLILVIATFLPASNPLHILEQFAQLISSLTGGFLALFAINTKWSTDAQGEDWIDSERLGWNLIGLALICWGIGESFWRYYVFHGQNPFPSPADMGYTLFPPLIFLGLLVQPSSFQSWQERFLTILDSLISMGAILAFAWYLLLGSLSQTLHEASLAKFLTLYYPTSDIALLSCVIFLLLRGQGRQYQATARRVSLLVIGLGLLCFVFSDFIFNLQQNDGSYVTDSPYILGWVIGMLTIGTAAYLRRFLPGTSPTLVEKRLQRSINRSGLSPVRIIPYALLALLFMLLLLNVTSQNQAQIQLRPVLFGVTLIVVGLVIVRQVIIQLDNANLTRRQAYALEQLALANKQVEEQAHMISERNLSLEQGITYLKSIQATLANGNLRARATLSSGELLPLAASLNLMADRLLKLDQADEYAEQLTAAITELCTALERARAGKPFVLPPHSKKFVLIRRLLLALNIKEYSVPLPGSTPITNLPSDRNMQTPSRPLPSPSETPSRPLPSPFEIPSRTNPPQSQPSFPPKPRPIPPRPTQ